MKRIASASVAIVFLLGASWLCSTSEAKDKPKKSPVQGTWTAEKGKGKITLSFTGKNVTMTKSRDDKSEDITGTFTLDASKTPNTIDITVTGGSAKDAEKYKGKTSLGIVKVEGDKLEWCANEPGKEGRPKMFADKDGDMGFLYITFDRAKKK